MNLNLLFIESYGYSVYVYNRTVVEVHYQNRQMQ